jgi:hypothetical protein
MSKTLTTPAPRLICFGSARRHTNAPPEVGLPEIEPPDEFDPG